MNTDELIAELRPIGGNCTKAADALEAMQASLKYETECVAAISAERDALQAENKQRNALQVMYDHTSEAAQDLANELAGLKAKLTNLQKQEPVGEVVEGVGPRLYKLEDRCKWGMKLYASPKALEPMTDVQINLMAHNSSPDDWNDLRFKDCWFKGFEEALERYRYITALEAS